jgi:hypothetical protein
MDWRRHVRDAGCSRVARRTNRAVRIALVLSLALIALLWMVHGDETGANAFGRFDHDWRARLQRLGPQLSASELAELEPGALLELSHTTESIPPASQIARWLGEPVNPVRTQSPASASRSGDRAHDDGIAVQRWSMRAEHVAAEAVYAAGRTGRLVVFLPELAGDGSTGGLVLRHAISRGDAALALVPLATPPVGGMRGLAHNLLLRAREARLALRVAREQVAPACLALIGLSAGALVAPAAVALEPAPDAIVLLLGGADLASIAAEGDLPWLSGRDVRRASLADPDAHTLLALAALDPLRHALHLRADRTLLVDAAFDRVVPRAARDALADALSAAERITYPTGHFSFELALPIALRRIDAFLDRVCAQSERAAPAATVRR